MAGLEYLFDTGLPAGNRAGLFGQSQALGYKLPGDTGPLRRDVQIDFGVAFTFF